MKSLSKVSAAAVHSATIALGGNLGDPVATVTRALASLAQIRHTRVRTVSSLYRSAPLLIHSAPAGQPDYVNAVALVTTALAPLELLDALQKMENEFGRERTAERWGARILDLDIITYDEREIATQRLTVPHPEAHHRCFVLAPLAEIAPGTLIPGYGRVATLLKDCDTGEAHKITLEKSHE